MCVGVGGVDCRLCYQSHKQTLRGRIRVGPNHPRIFAVIVALRCVEQTAGRKWETIDPAYGFCLSNKGLSLAWRIIGSFSRLGLLSRASLSLFLPSSLPFPCTLPPLLSGPMYASVALCSKASWPIESVRMVRRKRWGGSKRIGCVALYDGGVPLHPWFWDKEG